MSSGHHLTAAKVPYTGPVQGQANTRRLINIPADSTHQTQYVTKREQNIARRFPSRDCESPSHEFVKLYGTRHEFPPVEQISHLIGGSCFPPSSICDCFTKGPVAIAALSIKHMERPLVTLLLHQPASSIVNAIQQGGHLQINSSFVSVCPVTKVRCGFSNRVLPSSFSRQPPRARAIAHAVLGTSLVS